MPLDNLNLITFQIIERYKRVNPKYDQISFILLLNNVFLIFTCLINIKLTKSVKI